MLLKWQEIFTVGHGDLDAEHKRLLDTINDIEEAEIRGVSSKISDLLTALHLIAIEHFRHENALISDIIAGAYSSKLRCEKFSEEIANEHRAEHARLLIKLETMLRSHGSEPEMILAPRLMHWFVEHATGQDADLRAFLKSK